MSVSQQMMIGDLVVAGAANRHHEVILALLPRVRSIHHLIVENVQVPSGHHDQDLGIGEKSRCPHHLLL
jgi:hypothetical protein